MRLCEPNQSRFEVTETLKNLMSWSLSRSHTFIKNLNQHFLVLDLIQWLIFSWRGFKSLSPSAALLASHGNFRLSKKYEKLSYLSSMFVFVVWQGKRHWKSWNAKPRFYSCLLDDIQWERGFECISDSSKSYWVLQDIFTCSSEDCGAGFYLTLSKHQHDLEDIQAI